MQQQDSFGVLAYFSKTARPHVQQGTTGASHCDMPCPRLLCRLLCGHLPAWILLSKHKLSKALHKTAASDLDRPDSRLTSASSTAASDQLLLR